MHYVGAAPVPPLLDGLATGQDRGLAFALGTRADTLPLVAPGTGAQDQPMPSAFGMQLPFMCAEEFAYIEPDDYDQSLAEASPLAAAFATAPFFGSLTAELCAEWPVSPADPAITVDATCATDRTPTFDAFLPDAPALGAERISGGERYETAATASRFTFPGGVSSVVVASGEDFADALSATPLAAGRAPLVLLPPEGTSDAVLEALEGRFGSIVAVGGQSALPDQAVITLRAALPPLVGVVPAR